MAFLLLHNYTDFIYLPPLKIFIKIGIIYIVFTYYISFKQLITFKPHYFRPFIYMKLKIIIL